MHCNYNKSKQTSGITTTFFKKCDDNEGQERGRDDNDNDHNTPNYDYEQLLVGLKWGAVMTTMVTTTWPHNE